MATPFLGEIKIVSFNFAPQGWALCNGQLLPINQNQALFSLLGTTYGGNGQVNFALPNLRDRVPIHRGAGFTQGQVGGSFTHTLNNSEIPQHTHQVLATNEQQNTVVPGNTTLFANVIPSESYSGTLSQPMNAQMVTNSGGSQPHNNTQPTLVLNFCIALQGIFPSQN
jgi:microcystin-dependent protein